MVLIAFMFGLVIGSFLNVCALRIPEGKFFSSIFSRCYHCGKPLTFWQNIPVVSFLFLRGSSYCCRRRLPWQYPAVELITGVLFVIAYYRYPFAFTYDGSIGFDDTDLIRFIFAAVFGSVLIVCSVIDLHHHIIPDRISLPMIAFSPVVFAIHPELDWQSSLIGIAAGYGVIYAIAWGYYFVRGAIGIGMGDAKLLAAIGGWLGFQAILPVLLYSSILGSLFGIGQILLGRLSGMKAEIPFGPFLSLGALIHLLSPWPYQELFV